MFLRLFCYRVRWDLEFQRSNVPGLSTRLLCGGVLSYPWWWNKPWVWIVLQKGAVHLKEFSFGVKRGNVVFNDCNMAIYAIVSLLNRNVHTSVPNLSSESDRKMSRIFWNQGITACGVRPRAWAVWAHCFPSGTRREGVWYLLTTAEGKNYLRHGPGE